YGGSGARHHDQRLQGPALARPQEGLRLPGPPMRAREPDESLPLPESTRRGADPRLRPDDAPRCGQPAAGGRALPFERRPPRRRAAVAAPARGGRAICGSRPAPDPPADLETELLAAIDSGAWAEVRERGLSSSR